MAPQAWFALLMIGLPLLVYLPTHLLLAWLFSMPATPVVSTVAVAPRAQPSPAEV